MLTVSDVTPEQITQFYLIDPKLCKMSLPDHQLKSLMETGEYISDEGDTYLGVYLQDELVALFRYEPVFRNDDPKNIWIHVYIHSWLHGVDFRRDVQLVLVDWFLEHTLVKRVNMQVPMCCKHVQDSIDLDDKWSRDGIIPKEESIWRGEPMEFIIYTMELKHGSV